MSMLVWINTIHKVTDYMYENFHKFVNIPIERINFPQRKEYDVLIDYYGGLDCTVLGIGNNETVI